MKYGRIGSDFTITKIERRTVGGTWITGILHGHWFQALVFPEHATYPGAEIGESQISKLSVRRLDDKREVFNWDRGLDFAAADGVVQQIVDFLVAHLADWLSASDTLMSEILRQKTARQT